MTQPECVVLIGLQAAGKTTFYRQRFALTHEHISKDDFPNARDRRGRQAQMLRAALSAGRSVAVDNTNASLMERQAVITIARECGARIVGYYLRSDRRTALARNRGREGRARVPDVAVLATAKRLAEPRLAEGFDELYSVRLTPSGDFEIEPMVE